MIFSGQSLQLELVDDSIAILHFNASNKKVNTLDKACLLELKQAITCLKLNQNVQGLLINSSKDSFIVGADINEFMPTFLQGGEKVREWLQEINQLFCEIEDLPFPTISAINGYTLGGGCELVLATDYRIASCDTLIGLPEVKLGIFPGFGGTVRMPRVIGMDNAIELICGGQIIKANKAQNLGLVDAICDKEKLMMNAIKMLKQAINQNFDWRQRRKLKLGPIRLAPPEAMLSFATAKALVSAKAGPHYPAPMTALRSMEQGAPYARDEALNIELNLFIPIASQSSTHALIFLYQQDQELKHKAKNIAKEQASPSSCAVIGAGIMGGGIAYQSASNHIPVVMKDIQNSALEQGMNEASKLLLKQVKRGKINTQDMANCLSSIRPSLELSSIKDCGIVIEAVVENTLIKQQVLSEVEKEVPHETVLCSNTSTIPITVLANALERPEQFCGMHFFNPVHRMPLVEIIRGAKSSEQSVAKVVAMALAMKKVPIVVNDCPGFFVNRVLFPYLFGFCQLIAQGFDYHHIDRVMEQDFGWPMGPAYLLDVIGIDTAHHAAQVMAEAYPNRMASQAENIIDVLFKQQLLGQKSGQGFYEYKRDAEGKVLKSNNTAADDIIKQHFEQAQHTEKNVDKDFIINAMMLPMINEVALCLEEGIVASAGEADMALIYGLGFPAFRGGPLHYLDLLGLDTYLNIAKEFQTMGSIYHLPKSLVRMAQNNASFYTNLAAEDKE